jgi:L-2,4-diaminobutyric acid acetyltransferase
MQGSRPAEHGDHGDRGGEADPIRFRAPVVEDGPEVWRLVNEVGTLDPNSSYTYVLLCRDFSETCLLAERDGQLQGFVTGYRPPAHPDTIFVWQVGVAPQARGQGLASRLLDGLIRSPGCRKVRFLETTVTPSNEASRAMFQSLARRLETGLVESADEGFPARLFPEAGHEAEPRLRIGPFDPSRLRQSTD